jgi:beta-N-acetylhexosaminidase
MAIVQDWPLSRRAAQLVVIPSLDFDLRALSSTIAAGVGGVLFLGDGHAPADLSLQAANADRVALGGVPLLTMADEEGGGVQRLSGLVTSLPWARQMAQTMSAAEVQNTAAAVGRQMRQAGVTMDLAPVLDVDGGPGPSTADADGLRSFSAAAATASLYGNAFMVGLRQGGVIPVLKHFPGLGDSTGNTDYGAASTLPLAALRAGGLMPFQAAITAGAPAIMVSNATVPGLSTGPASLSPAAIGGLLRRELAFEGLVLTDSLSAGAVEQTGDTLPQAALAAVEAGADMVLFGSTLTPAQTVMLSPTNVEGSTRQIVNALVAAVETGALPATRLDEAVIHVLAAKGVDVCYGARS